MYVRNYIARQETSTTVQIEAQLPQRDRATCYVSKFVLCFMSYESYKGFKQQK